MVREPELFRHNAKDSILVVPLAKADPSWVLMGLEPQTSRLTFTTTTSFHHFSRLEIYPTHADSDVYWATVRLPMRVKGHNPDLDFLTGLIGGSVRLDERG